MILTQDLLALLLIESGLQCVDTEASHIIAFQCETVRHITVVCLSKNCRTATGSSRITLFVPLIIFFIIKVAFSQVKVDTVQTEKFW